jgi:ATP-dependent DNA ligase
MPRHQGRDRAAADHRVIAFSTAIAYLSAMSKITFEPCLPTRGTKVPARPDWIHEIKHDGYRLIVVRDGARLRLFTGNGHDWTGRYPLIVEAAPGVVMLTKE